MDLLSMKYLQYQPVSIETLIGKKGKGQGNMRDVEIALVKEYAAEDADITLQLKEIFEPLLGQNDVTDLFEKVENPWFPYWPIWSLKVWVSMFRSWSNIQRTG